MVGLKQICHMEYQEIPSPFVDTVYCLHTKENLQLAFYCIEVNVHKLKVNRLPEFSWLGPC